MQESRTETLRIPVEYSVRSTLAPSCLSDIS